MVRPNQSTLSLQSMGKETTMTDEQNSVVSSEAKPLAAKSRRARNLQSRPGVLRTESKAEHDQLFADFTRDIEPRDIFERSYVEDIVFHTWEIMRYRRVKNGILGNRFRAAVESLLFQIQLPPSPSRLSERSDAARTIAYEWQLCSEGQKRVLAMLNVAGLDESAIEAAAFRLVVDDLEKADRMLSAAEAGRDKALRSIVKYRKSFANQLRLVSDRALAADEALIIAKDTVN
jgi:hypothetical protein